MLDPKDLSIQDKETLLKTLAHDLTSPDKTLKKEARTLLDLRPDLARDAYSFFSTNGFYRKAQKKMEKYHLSPPTPGSF